MTLPVDASLFVHLHLTAPQGMAEQSSLLAAWTALLDTLELSEEKDGYSTVPRAWGDVHRECVLAAAQGRGSDNDRFKAAVLRRLHEDVVVSVALSPGSGVRANEWPDLELEWRAAERASVARMQQLDDAPSLFGSCQIFVAEHRAPSLPVCAQYLPGRQRADAPGFRAGAGIRVWPLDPEADMDDASSGVRAPCDDSFAVLAEPGHEPALTSFVWADGDALPVLARQHRLMARIDVVEERWLDQRRQVTDLVRVLDVGLGTLQGNLDSLPTQRDQLDKLTTETAALQRKLVELRPLIREMRRNRLAVSAAVDALSSQTRLYHDAEHGSPLDASLARGSWLTGQLEVDIEIAESDHASGSYVLDYVSAAVERGRSELLRQVAENQQEFAKRAERFNLVQAGVIGAVVMSLTAVQSLQYRITILSGGAQPALIALLAALVLWLSLIAVRLFRQPPGSAALSDPWGVRIAEIAASAVVGGAAGWLIDSAILRDRPWWWSLDEPGRIAASWASAVVGGIVMLAVMVVWTGLRRRRHDQETAARH